MSINTTDYNFLVSCNDQTRHPMFPPCSDPYLVGIRTDLQQSFEQFPSPVRAKIFEYTFEESDKESASPILYQKMVILDLFLSCTHSQYLDQKRLQLGETLISRITKEMEDFKGSVEGGRNYIAFQNLKKQINSLKSIPFPIHSKLKAIARTAIETHPVPLDWKPTKIFLEQIIPIGVHSLIEEYAWGMIPMKCKHREKDLTMSDSVDTWRHHIGAVRIFEIFQQLDSVQNLFSTDQLKNELQFFANIVQTFGKDIPHTYRVSAFCSAEHAAILIPMILNPEHKIAAARDWFIPQPFDNTPDDAFDRRLNGKRIVEALIRPSSAVSFEESLKTKLIQKDVELVNSFLFIATSETVKDLIKLGAFIDARDKNGFTILQHAIHAAVGVVSNSTCEFFQLGGQFTKRERNIITLSSFITWLLSNSAVVDEGTVAFFKGCREIHALNELPTQIDQIFKFIKSKTNTQSTDASSKTGDAAQNPLTELHNSIEKKEFQVAAKLISTLAEPVRDQFFVDLIRGLSRRTSWTFTDKQASRDLVAQCNGFEFLKAIKKA